MTSKTYNSKTNRYPTIFPYADKYSVMGNSANDVLISEEHNIVGKSNKAAKPNYDEEVLVLGKRKDGMYVIVMRIGKFVSPESHRGQIWYRNGGKIWDFNYEAERLSEKVFLTYEQIAEITGCQPNEARKVASDRERSPKYGNYRISLRDFLKKK